MQQYRNNRNNGNIYDLRKDLQHTPPPSQQKGSSGSADGRYGFNGEPLSFAPDRTANGTVRRTRTDNSIEFPSQPRRTEQSGTRVTPGDQLTFAAQADPAASDASGSAAASAAVQTDDRLDALNELQAKLEEYGMLDDVTRMEFADTDQMAFLYQDRVSVLLGTRNDLDYKLDRARYVLTNADGKGCAPTDTGRLDFSHVSAGSTRKIYFAQGQPTLPSGYVVPEKTVPEEPDTSAAEDTAADGAEDAAAAQPADDTAAAAEETPLTDPARMTANNEENPM